MSGGGLLVTGDFASMLLFQKRVGELSELPRLVALGSVAKLEAIEDAGFASGADPYGNPWAPLKSGGPALHEGAGSVEVTSFSTGKIRATAHYPYNFHNSGTKQMSKKTALKVARAKAGIGNGRDASGKFTRGAGATAPQVQAKAAAAAAYAAATVHAPKRQIVPDDGAGIPSAWDHVFLEVAQSIFEKAVST